MEYITTSEILEIYIISPVQLYDFLYGKRTTGWDKSAKKRFLAGRKPSEVKEFIHYVKLNPKRKQSPKLWTKEGVALFDSKFKKREIENN